MDDKNIHVSDIHDGDMIYRQDAVNEFKTAGSVFVYGESTCRAIISRLKTVPSVKEIPFEAVEAYCKPRCLSIVTAEMMEELKRGYDAPKMKFGYWLVGPDEHGRMCGICSNCKHRQYAGTSPHCPYCGSKNTEVKKID